jgi:hypothetical protein
MDVSGFRGKCEPPAGIDATDMPDRFAASHITARHFGLLGLDHTFIHLLLAFDAKEDVVPCMAVALSKHRTSW